MQLRDGPSFVSYFDYSARFSSASSSVEMSARWRLWAAGKGLYLVDEEFEKFYTIVEQNVEFFSKISRHSITFNN